jgi:hypothetical protein
MIARLFFFWFGDEGPATFTYQGELVAGAELTSATQLRKVPRVRTGGAWRPASLPPRVAHPTTRLIAGAFELQAVVAFVPAVATAAARGILAAPAFALMADTAWRPIAITHTAPTPATRTASLDLKSAACFVPRARRRPTAPVVVEAPRPHTEYAIDDDALVALLLEEVA